MATIFTKIINGEIPCHKIGEDEKHLAFLDISPISDGHTLVIPKREVDYIFSMEDSELSELMIFAKAMAKKIQTKIPCLRIGVMVCGVEVPHTHVHLVPFEKISDLNFANAKEKSTEELLAIAAKING